MRKKRQLHLVAVYGTLKRGCKADWSKCGAIFRQHDQVRGRLYVNDALPVWPILVLDPTGPLVNVEVFEAPEEQFRYVVRGEEANRYSTTLTTLVSGLKAHMFTYTQAQADRRASNGGMWVRVDRYPAPVPFGQPIKSTPPCQNRRSCNCASGYCWTTAHADSFVRMSDEITAAVAENGEVSREVELQFSGLCVHLFPGGRFEIEDTTGG